MLTFETTLAIELENNNYEEVLSSANKIVHKTVDKLMSNCADNIFSSCEIKHHFLILYFGLYSSEISLPQKFILECYNECAKMIKLSRK